jgi:hypothetical protein
MHFGSVQQPRPETAAEAAIDSLVAVNIGSTDMAVRKRTWAEIQRLINRETFVIWLPTACWKVALRNGFGNLEPSVMPPRLLWNADCIFVKRPRSSPTSAHRTRVR